MHRTFHIRNIIRNPPTSRLSNENQGLPDEKLELPDKKLSELKQTPDTNSFNQLFSMLKNFIQTNTSNKIIQERPKHQYQLEARDREVSIDLPTVYDKLHLKLWITDVVKTIFSSAFNSISKNQMIFEQAKIYCSENIFKNIVRLREKYPLSELELEQIDNHIEKRVIKYLGAKYPLTGSTLVNKKLQGVVREIDNIESLSNNYFTNSKNSKIVFEFRQSGNYNDLIMEFLNDLMRMPEQIKQKEKVTNYEDFEQKMPALFLKLGDEDWIDNNQENKEQSQEEKKERDRINNKEKKKYNPKVQVQTQYIIGRKISENTPQFTPAEIESGNIQIKNPQILRILTKWCQELQEKYKNSYFNSRSQSVKLQRGEKINNLQPRKRKEIDQQLEEQNKIIKTTMDELLKNNYKMQANILQNQLQRQGDEHIDKIQKISGKFSHKVVKNLHSSIITYLNKLIHGILKVSKSCFKDQSSQDWPSPPNLLSFKVGDLMRCKCSSKENEILRIYEKINRISRQCPQKLKVVRIKNRLKTDTNDILMNVRFNDSILCEIQLEIKTTASEFIKCSNKFHHYIYELQRTLFGPLTQLGSIWNSLDKRAEIYEELVQQQQNESEKQFQQSKKQQQQRKQEQQQRKRQQQQRKKQLQQREKQQQQQIESKILNEHKCKKITVKIKIKPYDKSFICSSCKLSYFHNRYILSHVKCTSCSYILCAKCRIKEKANTNLKELLGNNQENYIDGKMLRRNQELPKFGLCVSMQSNQAKVQPFTIITYRDINYLLGLKGSQINQLSRIRFDKEKTKFRNNFLFFNAKNDCPFKQIKQQQAQNNYILPLIMTQNYKKQKETISLMGMGLQDKECRKILSADSQSPKQFVKNIFLTSNLLSEIPFKPKEFPNVQWITLNYNKMESLKESEVFNCNKLKHLDLSYNQISYIDDRIMNLTNLEVLNLQSNQITTIPQSIGNLKKLKEIDFALNKNLQILPSRFAELKNLELIDITWTSISEIPCTSEGFAKLKILRTYKTQITQFPQGFKKANKIQEASCCQLAGLSLDNLSYQSINQLDIRHCGFTEMPSIISNMKKLRTLYLGSNKIEDWKNSFSQLRQLQLLSLHKCNLTNFPSLSNCCNLKTLKISKNELTLIPAENIEGLVNLEEFDCQQNKLTVLPTNLTKFRKLRKLVASDNQFETLFGRDFQFDGTSCWPKLSTVELNNNHLQTIPLPLCYCPKLESLYMKNNKIESIPPKIKHSSRIKKLILSNNRISEIPEELSALTQLSQLYLDQNQIVRIPLFVRNFTKITEFYCNNQTIQTIQ